MARILIKDILALETGDPAVGTLHNVDLLIDGARIARIAKSIPVERDMEVINGTIRVVTPGFVNTHHHLYQTLTRAVPFVQDA